MKKKIESKQRRRMLRLELELELLKQFEILCIQKDIPKARGAEDALREWIERERKNA